MADDNDCFRGFRPAGSSQHLCRIGPGRNGFNHLVIHMQGIRGLTSALRRAHQDAHFLGQPRPQPLSHLRRLLVPFLSQFTGKIGRAVLGFGVTP
jgi:hypothetical protein